MNLKKLLSLFFSKGLEIKMINIMTKRWKILTSKVERIRTPAAFNKWKKPIKKAKRLTIFSFVLKFLYIRCFITEVTTSVINFILSLTGVNYLKYFFAPGWRGIFNFKEFLGFICFA